MSENNWLLNLTNIENRQYVSTNGYADEVVAIGRILKAGFSCAQNTDMSSKYDVIITMPGSNKFIRAQIKGSRMPTIGFRCRRRDLRGPFYTAKDCDVFIFVDSHNGDCYIIPIEDSLNWSGTKRFSTMKKYKENWMIIKNILTS